MLVLVAIPVNAYDYDDIVVASNPDGLKKKCEDFCHNELYYELQDVKMETEIYEDKVLVNITGKDPEDLYIYTENGDFNYTEMFVLVKKETE